jgi:hypothetical protein
MKASKKTAKATSKLKIKDLSPKKSPMGGLSLKSYIPPSTPGWNPSQNKATWAGRRPRPAGRASHLGGARSAADHWQAPSGATPLSTTWRRAAHGVVRLSGRFGRIGANHGLALIKAGLEARGWIEVKPMALIYWQGLRATQKRRGRLIQVLRLLSLASVANKKEYAHSSKKRQSEGQP